MSKPPERTEGVSPPGRANRAASPVGPVIEHDPSRAAPADMRIGDRGGRRGSTGGASTNDGVRLDAAIDSLLAADELDPVSRVRLKETRRVIADGGRRTTSAEGATLSRSLFEAVMPRLRHPDVLRVERHRALLEQLANDLNEADEGGVVRTSTLVVHRELKRLAMLRARQNALVKG